MKDVKGVIFIALSSFCYFVISFVAGWNIPSIDVILLFILMTLYFVSLSRKGRKVEGKGGGLCLCWVILGGV